MRRDERNVEKQNMEKAPPPPTEEEVTMRSTTEVDRPVTWGELRAVLRGEQAAQVRMGVKTWRPVTGGILAIITGVMNVIFGIETIVGSFPFFTGFSQFGIIPSTAIAALLIALGVISFAGGWFAVTRRSRLLALIGSVTSLFPSPVILPFILGTLSLIFVSLGRQEFRRELY